MHGEENRWHSELKAVLAAVAVLALLCVALIAQALVSTGAMVAILGRSAEALMTVSEFSRDELAARCGLRRRSVPMALRML